MKIHALRIVFLSSQSVNGHVEVLILEGKYENFSKNHLYEVLAKINNYMC